MNKFQENSNNTNTPLAERLRPTTLDEVAGQEHLLGEGKPLRHLIESGEISSLILWGPPGCGKTTIARLIANYTKSYYIEFSAVTSGVAEVRKVIAEAKERLEDKNQKTILFIDEIHRFNKAQQDAFLPHVEKGTIILIGATTENPGFSINAPLISRSRVFNLHELTQENILSILKKAILSFPKTKFDQKSLQFIAKSANGDARSAINAAELAAQLSKNIDLETAEKAVQRKAIYYDKKGDWHYDTISAFIKSMRGGDPDATLYWLARMLKSGEDPVFIARRMVIFASEDINLANNTALVLATEAMTAVKMIGMPEAQIILAHVAVYLAKCPKTIATYAAYMEASRDIEIEHIPPVPLHLRNASNKVMKEIGAGKGHIRYQWIDPEKHKDQMYLPEELQDRRYFRPEEFK
ncbi:MAG: replication-associated recombination protein A [bacterium]|nr:replication-associated recombination protein A [bacterium]